MSSTTPPLRSVAFGALLLFACPSAPTPCPRDGGSMPNGVVAADGGPCALGRHTDDQPDDFDADQIHVMYVLAADSADESLDTNGSLATSATAANGWLAGLTGEQRFRIDTCQGRLDATFVRLAMSNDTLRQSDPGRMPEAIERELNARGLLRPRKIYVVYYGGGYEQCGQADSPPDNPGQVAVLFPRGGDFIKVCGSLTTCDEAPGKIEAAFVHEVFHVLGAVARCAPHFDASRPGHVTDEGDLMNGVHLASATEVLDVGRDDYFGHHNAGCVDVALSAFLEPPAPNAEDPPGWSMGVPGTLVSPGGTCRVDSDCPPPLPRCCPGGSCLMTCP